MEETIDEICNSIAAMPLAEKVEAINNIRKKLHEVSPFNREPVDCVLWIPQGRVAANDYNPNTVAPPEMKLLEISILQDGYTQPIVGWPNEKGIEVVDGFHRSRVGRESPEVRQRVRGYLPVAVINEDRLERNDRMAATIRHNRARGKHRVDSMSDMVIELKRRNWSNEKISEQLGMEADEVLRLCQISGLAEMFSDQEFSASWDVEGNITEADFVELTDDTSTYGEEIEEFRTVNTSDEDRIFHTYEHWECRKAGFYNGFKTGMNKEQCEEAYREFLADPDRFADTLEKVIVEWKHSCEHYLTNNSMNRIAWLGQAALCYALGIPSTFRGGFSLLNPEQQSKANEVALVYLNKWLVANGRPETTMDVAYSGRQSDIY